MLSLSKATRTIEQEIDRHSVKKIYANTAQSEQMRIDQLTMEIKNVQDEIKQQRKKHQ